MASKKPAKALIPDEPPQDWKEWIGYAKARLTYLEAKIEELELEKIHFKQVIRQQEDRILERDR